MVISAVVNLKYLLLVNSGIKSRKFLAAKKVDKDGDVIPPVEGEV